MSQATTRIDPSGSTPPSSVPTTSTGPKPSAIIPRGSRIYVSMQGDFWDMIAIRVYGAKRGNEHLMFRLLEANYPLREVVEFSAGIPVIVPDVDVSAEVPLVPWKSATILSS